MDDALYPPLTADDDGYLAVSDGHSLYYEVSGNPSDIAIP